MNVKSHRVKLTAAMTSAAALLLLIASCTQPQAPSYWGLTPPDSAEVFPLEMLTQTFDPHAALEISPDGTKLAWSVFWPDTTGFHQKTVGSEFVDDQFSEPQVLLFSSEYSCGGPQYSADGNSMYFTSPQPVGDETESYTRVWMTQHTDQGWGDPVLVDAPFNRQELNSQISIAANGNLYFSRRAGEGINHDLFVSEYINGQFQPERPLPGTANTENLEADPWVDPQERFILFSSAGREDSHGRTDIYISHRQADGSWGDGINLGPVINGEPSDRFASMTHDGEALFFTRMLSIDGENTNKFYWIKTDAVEAFK
jgi:hypothetical protein